MPGAEPGMPGLGQLLRMVAPLAVMLLRIFGGDGWDDLGLRPNVRGNGFWWYERGRQHEYLNQTWIDA